MNLILIFSIFLNYSIVKGLIMIGVFRRKKRKNDILRPVIIHHFFHLFLLRIFILCLAFSLSGVSGSIFAEEAVVLHHISDESDCNSLPTDCSIDGTVAVLCYNKLIEIDVNGNVNKETFPGGGKLLYDSTGRLHLFINEGGNKILHYTRNESNEWTSESFPVSWGVIAIDDDDFFHIVRSHWHEPIKYATNRSGSWQTSTILPYSGDNYYIYGMDVEHQWKVHILYGDDEGHKYLTNSSGNWKSELVHTKLDLPDDNSFPTTPFYNYPDFAVFPDGSPLFLSRYSQLVSTCSTQYSQLRCLRRTETGSWSPEIIAHSSDNFYGSDGDNYTGFNPHIVTDDCGCAHAIFSDGYFRHDPHQEWQIGQIRYAVNGGGGWDVRTIFSQNPNLDPTRSGSGEEDEILSDIIGPIDFTVSPDGQDIHVFGMRIPSTSASFEADLMYINFRNPCAPPPPTPTETPVPQSSIQGTITDSLTGKPVSGATVQIDGGEYRVFTNAQGGFNLYASQGEHVLQSWGFAYEYDERNITVPSNSVLDVGEISLSKIKGAVVGKLVDGQSGDPVAEATVQLDGGATWRTYTDEQGEFLLINITPGNHTLQTWAYAYAFQEHTINVSDTGSTDLGEMALDIAPGTVIGQVMDECTSRPIMNAQVQYDGGGPGKETKTSITGRFILVNVPEGNHRLQTWGWAYSYASKEFTHYTSICTDTGQTKLNPIGGTVSGRLVDSDNGLPVYNGVAQLDGGSVPTWKSTTALNGDFILYDVSEGQRQFQAWGYAYRFHEETINTYTGQSYLLGDVQMTSTPNTFSGRVLDAQTRLPIEDAEVVLSGNGVNITASSFPDGRFVLLDVPAGAWDITVDADEHILTYFRAIHPGNDKNIEIGDVLLQGTIVN